MSDLHRKGEQDRAKEALKWCIRMEELKYPDKKCLLPVKKYGKLKNV